MKGETIIFYLLAATTLISAMLAVSSRQLFRSAVYLLFSLIGIAGIYFWLQYEFIAAVQIVVYAGGIAVLIIFSIFLTQKSGEELPKQNAGRLMFSALAALAGFGLTILQIIKYSFIKTNDTAVDATVLAVGTRMLGVGKEGFALPFELVSMLLLAAMIGCIVIAMRSKPETT
ncbi:MAG: NADH-quinone oxidoreductase subunit J family protein [Chitinophagaceae bacterium]